MKNIESMTCKQLLSEIKRLEKAFKKSTSETENKAADDLYEAIDKLIENENKFRTISLEDLESKRQDALLNKDMDAYNSYSTLISEKASYEKYSKDIDAIYNEYYVQKDQGEIGMTESTPKRSIKKKVFKTVLLAGVILGVAFGVKSCKKHNSGLKVMTSGITSIFDKNKREEPTSTPSTEETNEVPAEETSKIEEEANTEQLMIEDAAKSYYADYANYYNKNGETTEISEQDIINIGYVLNDREDLLSVEDFKDACDNIENGCGYNPSMLMSITSSLQNKSTIKSALGARKYAKWNKNLKRQVRIFKPAKLSKLVLKNSPQLKNVKRIEKNIQNVVDSVKSNGKISSSARRKYNNMLVDFHYNNAYNNEKSISNDTENNDNLGFKYFVNVAAYDAYGIGTTINPYKTVIKSTKILDPITGKAATVKITPTNRERNVITRIANGENTARLNKKYTKIKNTLPELGYKADLCSDRKNLQKQVKHYNKTKKLVLK